MTRVGGWLDRAPGQPAPGRLRQQRLVQPGHRRAAARQLHQCRGVWHRCVRRDLAKPPPADRVTTLLSSPPSVPELQEHQPQMRLRRRALADPAADEIWRERREEHRIIQQRIHRASSSGRGSVLTMTASAFVLTPFSSSSSTCHGSALIGTILPYPQITDCGLYIRKRQTSCSKKWRCMIEESKYLGGAAAACYLLISFAE